MRTQARRLALPLLLASACAAAPASTRTTTPSEPDLPLANAQAVAASHRYLPEALEVPLPPHTPDGVRARLVFVRAALARGARLMSDLEFHFAVEEDGAYECVVRMQTLPAGTLPPAPPPDAVTERLTRLVRQPADGAAHTMPCDSQTYAAQAPLGGQPVTQYDPDACAWKDHPNRSTLRPFWAAQLGFLPQFYDLRHPPDTGGRWVLLVSEPQCAAVTAPLAASFVRGTIYREGPPLPPAPEVTIDPLAPTAPR